MIKSLHSSFRKPLIQMVNQVVLRDALLHLLRVAGFFQLRNALIDHNLLSPQLLHGHIEMLSHLCSNAQ